MSSLFGGGPSIPKPVAATPPTVDDAKLRAEELQRLRMARGSASNELVKNETNVSTAAKVLTGN